MKARTKEIDYAALAQFEEAGCLEHSLKNIDSTSESLKDRVVAISAHLKREGRQDAFLPLCVDMVLS